MSYEVSASVIISAHFSMHGFLLSVTFLWYRGLSLQLVLLIVLLYLIVGPLDECVSCCLDFLEKSAHIFQLCFCSYNHLVNCQDAHSTCLEVFWDRWGDLENSQENLSCKCCFLLQELGDVSHCIDSCSGADDLYILNGWEGVENINIQSPICFSKRAKYLWRSNIFGPPACFSNGRKTSVFRQPDVYLLVRISEWRQQCCLTRKK